MPLEEPPDVELDELIELPDDDDDDDVLLEDDDDFDELDDDFDDETDDERDDEIIVDSDWVTVVSLRYSVTLPSYSV